MTRPDSPHVLTVDDEQALADIYTYWLEDCGYTVSTAYRGAEALDQLSENIDVVLLDRQMPGLNGDEVLDHIRRQGYQCRVAMVTAVDPDFDIVEMGFDAYLTKPISKTDVQQTVDRLVDRSVFESKHQEYFALVEKKATLQVHKTTAELDQSQKYADLEARLTGLEAELNEEMSAFTEEDFAVAFRDL